MVKERREECLEIKRSTTFRRLIATLLCCCHLLLCTHGLVLLQLLTTQKPSNMCGALTTQPDLNVNMRCALFSLFCGSFSFSDYIVLCVLYRYILFDWLCEVAEMKLLSSLVLHSAMECVDRYLCCRLLPRSQLQLLGVTCMVLSARFLGKDIVTIREAAWLTDGTYSYEEVVRYTTVDTKSQVLTQTDKADTVITKSVTNRSTTGA